MASGASRLAATRRPPAVLPLPAVAARALSTHPQESFMSGSNSVYVEEMYRAWLKNRERCVVGGFVQ